MRTVTLFVMKPNKTTEWITVPWGRSHLNYVREQGYVILMSV
jgi:hypothetical protein